MITIVFAPISIFSGIIYEYWNMYLWTRKQPYVVATDPTSHILRKKNEIYQIYILGWEVKM